MSTEDNEDQQLLTELSKPEDVSEYIEQRQEMEAEERPPQDEHERLVKEVREKHPELKRASRSQRYKKSRDRALQEVQQLRERYEPEPADTVDTGEHVDTGYEQPTTTPAEPNPQLEHSLDTAKKTYGPAFDAAYAAFTAHVSGTRDMDAYNRVMNSAHPGEELVRWHAENPYASEMQQGRHDVEFQTALRQHEDEIRVQTECKLRAEALARHVPDFMETVQSVEGVDELLR
jgi:hypothetical protein